MFLGSLLEAPELFLLSAEVFGMSGTMSIYKYIYKYIYVNNMADTKPINNLSAIFQYKTCLFAPDFINKEPLRPKEFFEVLVWSITTISK